MKELSEVKEKLALACRLLYMQGLIDHSGLVGARLPGESRMVLNPRTMRGTRGRHPGMMSAKDMVVVDGDGKRIEGENGPPSETPIFTSVFRNRPDVNACFHLHLRWATLFTAFDRPLVPIHNLAAVFDEVPVLDDANLIQTDQQGDALAEALGKHRAVLLRSHGAVIVGEDIESAFAASVVFEENAKQLYDALLLGEPRVLEGEKRREAAARTWKEMVILKIWDYHILKARQEGRMGD